MRTVKRKLPDAWDDPEDEIVLRRILAESLLEDQVRQAAFAAKTSKLFKTESGAPLPVGPVISMQLDIIVRNSSQQNKRELVTVPMHALGKSTLISAILEGQDEKKLLQIPTTQAQRELIEGTSDGKECEENRVVLTLPEGKRTLMITLNFLQSKKGISECVEPRDFCLIINCIEYLGMEFNWQEKPSAAMFDYLDKVMRTISDMDINALWTRKTTGLLDKWVQSLFDRGLSLKHYCGGKSHWLQYEIANRHKELVFADLDAKIKLVVSKRGEPKNLLLGKHLDPNLPLSPAAQQFIQERMSEASQHYPVELVAATNEEGKSNLYVFLDWWVSALLEWSERNAQLQTWLQYLNKHPYELLPPSAVPGRAIVQNGKTIAKHEFGFPLFWLAPARDCLSLFIRAPEATEVMMEWHLKFWMMDLAKEVESYNRTPAIHLQILSRITRILSTLHNNSIHVDIPQEVYSNPRVPFYRYSNPKDNTMFLCPSVSYGTVRFVSSAITEFFWANQPKDFATVTSDTTLYGVEHELVDHLAGVLRVHRIVHKCLAAEKVILDYLDCVHLSASQQDQLVETILNPCTVSLRKAKKLYMQCPQLLTSAVASSSENFCRLHLARKVSLKPRQFLSAKSLDQYWEHKCKDKSPGTVWECPVINEFPTVEARAMYLEAEGWRKNRPKDPLVAANKHFEGTFAKCAWVWRPVEIRPNSIIQSLYEQSNKDENKSRTCVLIPAVMKGYLRPLGTFCHEGHLQLRDEHWLDDKDGKHTNALFNVLPSYHPTNLFEKDSVFQYGNRGDRRSLRISNESKSKREKGGEAAQLSESDEDEEEEKQEDPASETEEEEEE